ncbi:esterase family protein [Paludibaculum fermentans]|uniref:Esterase family protein n=1 Tax=Paludibaculum fermentans TaxID=1473598 RepID=A0A7S7NWC1_PALFE|nr:alpha/beta hydrolase-fold protein [Paludibaculum fermentans]QOY90389.1 esterase family protein [Paludibaculum fermentans]
MNREYHKWFSTRLQREMELLVFGHAGARVLIFPTREGRFFDYENWGLVAALQHHLSNGWLQLFCVDSIDSESLYGRWSPPPTRIARHKQYEEYILREVVPFTQWRNPSPFLIGHGCSVGAYHAINIAFRHPELFGKVVALSGRYDLTKPAGTFPDLFDGYYDEDIYFHTPNHFLPNLTDQAYIHRLRRVEIVLAVGDADPFYSSNQALSRDLWGKGVSHQLEVWNGEAHRARYWRQMVPLYI